MSYFGDIRLGDTIDIKFTTRKFSTGAPFALSGGVISAYVGNGTTEITAGITLTADFDTRTGLNNVRVVATSGNGFATATNVQLVITTGTVDSVSVVGEVIGSFSIENRSAVMPTTAGRTLDVSAGGEAGVDWANVGSPTTTLALTGTTVATTQKVDVETIKTNPVVNAGTVTFPTTATLASTTNITAGTITTATNLTNERGKYANGAVWIGPTANTNTVSYTDGIITNPVSTAAAAKTIADALGMRRFEVIRTGTVQIGATIAGYRYAGVGWSLTTTGGSRDVGTSAFLGALVTGGTFASTTGTINWNDCEFSTGVTVGVSDMHRCDFAGTLTLSTAGNYDFIDCASIVAGTSAPVFAVPAGTVNISFRRWSGGIRITGITSGTTISIDMVSGGTVTLEGADGNVQVRGMASAITDSRTGTPTLGTNAVINQTTIATPTNITAGTIATVSGNVNGSVGSVAGNVDGNVVGTVASVVGAVGSVTGLTAADVGAIKTQTDKFVFTVANQVDANVQYVNDVQVNGTGALGNEWGP